MSGYVLFVVAAEPTKIGGLEVFAAALAHELEKQQHRLIVAAQCLPSGSVRDFLNRARIECVELRHQEGLSVAQAIEFAGVVRRYRPTAVLYTLNGVLRTYPWIARILGVRRVLYHDQTSRPSVLRRLRGVKRMLAKLLVAKVDVVLAASAYIGNVAAIEGTMPRRKIDVVYSGTGSPPDPTGARSEWRMRLGIAPSEGVVMQCGSIEPTKGVPDLLLAASKVLATLPARFVFVGDGTHRGEYERLSVALGIADHVIWTGYLESPLQQGIYAIADVYCQMSVWEEAFGYSLAEAMSFALPIVATRAGAIPELVRHESTGLLVDRGDCDAMAAALTRLLRDALLRSRLGEEGRRRYLTQFTVERMANDFARRLLPDARAPSRAGDAEASAN